MMTYHVVSKRGDRELNEDFAGVREQDGCAYFVLADGLGGHDKGEVASRLTVESVLSDFQTPFQAGHMERAFLQAQERLLAEQERLNAREQMKTTLVVLACDHIQSCWGHVGDSRLYYFHKNRLAERTLDHSVPQMLAASGEIKEREIRGHEDRNRLLRVMGIEWDRPRFELREPVKLDKKQAFLLCTDGWWELIEEKQMLRCLKKASCVEVWMELMEAEILKNGQGKNMDNYSAIGVFLS